MAEVYQHLCYCGQLNSSINSTQRKLLKQFVSETEDVNICGFLMKSVDFPKKYLYDICCCDSKQYLIKLIM